MGGRGAYFSGASARFESREFDAISAANGGRIKVLKKRDHVENLHFPIYSNTPNTTYFVVDERDNSKIASIGMYRDHGLVESVDLTDTKGLHWHKWRRSVNKKGEEIVEKTKSHGSRDRFDLKPRHLKLIKFAREWEAGKR